MQTFTSDDCSLTWAEAINDVPELIELQRETARFYKLIKRDFPRKCNQAMNLYYMTTFKPRLNRLVGQHAYTQNPRLRTMWAYNLCLNTAWRGLFNV